MGGYKQIIPAFFFAFVAPATAHDEDLQSWPTAQTLILSGGYFLPELDTTVVITDDNGNFGSSISFEDNLGLDDNKSTAMLYAEWRFFKRHSLNLSHFKLARDGGVRKVGVIIVGDRVVDLDLPVESFFNIDAIELRYSYSLIFNERMDLSIGVGISHQDLELGLQATASSPIPGEIIESRLASAAPLPTLNFDFDYAFSDKWLFRSKLGWLAIETDLGGDDLLEGKILNAAVGIEWRAFRHVGVFANYQLIDVEADITDSGFRYDIEYNYAGPVIGISVNF
jgi:hypothetical protein